MCGDGMCGGEGGWRDVKVEGGVVVMDGGGGMCGGDVWRWREVWW